MKNFLKFFLTMVLIVPLFGQEKLISFGFEFENVSDRNLINNGGKAIITLPMGSITKDLESTQENISSKSTRAFLKGSLHPLDFLTIYGKVGLTNLEWAYTALNPPGEPGTPPQEIKFKGNISFIWGGGAKIKVVEIVGFKAELNVDYLAYKPDGKFYITGIEFKEFEEEQFRIQHGGGTVKYTIDTAVNEIMAGILLSKKIGIITPYLGGGYIDMKPKATLVMEGTPADIGYVKYDMKFDSKMKENIYIIGGINISLIGPVNLNLAIRTKGVSTLSANLNFVF